MFYHSKENVAKYIKMAEGYDGREIIKKLKDYLPANSSVLELGSGPGVDLQLLSEIFGKVTGSDFSQVFLDLLKQKKIACDLLVLDAITLETGTVFDGIFSNKVLHHLTNEELVDSVKNQARCLNEGGVICHSFWKGEGFETMHGMLFNYHLETDLEKVFGEEFEVLLLETYTELEENDSILLIGKLKRGKK